MRATALLLAALLLVTGILAAAQAPALKASNVAFATTGAIRNYPSWNADWTSAGTHAWRIANGTGNCCENHVSATATGRLVDTGSETAIYSDDGGATWRRVSGALFPREGEGSGVSAPNGDFVGMTWDPYSGDRVTTFKHVAAENAWYSSVIALHSPFYDRPWIGIVPGPIRIGDTEAPYMSVMSGGWPIRTTYYSLDGLTYFLPPPATLASLQRASFWLDFPAVAWADYVQPISHARIVPLPSGGALVPGTGCAWAHLRTDGTSACFTLGDGSPLPNGLLRFDSQGRLHAWEGINGGFRHRISDDGARTWLHWANHTYPAGARLVSWDAAANGAADAAALSVQLTQNGATRILVYKVVNVSSAPTTTIHQVGLANFAFGSGILAGGPRMDFMTTAMLPDGRVAVTFGDSLHGRPTLAVEAAP